MGIKGLRLLEVMLISRLNGSDPKSSKLLFDVTAMMKLRKATVQAHRFYSKDHMEFSVFPGNLTQQDIDEISYELTKVHLDVFAGISAKGDLKIFGKRAQFDCTLGKAVKIKATIEKFSLDPLTVRGATKPDPIVDIEFSAQAQKIFIDGAVDIWDASAALHLDIGLLPKTRFDFFVHLKQSDLFLLKLEAQLKGTINIKNYKTWENADFTMYGLVEQRVIAYVTAQLDQQVSAAHEAAKEGFEMVKQDMEAKEAAFKAGCDDAIRQLEIAKAVWLAKKAQADSNFANARASAAAERKRLQDKAIRVAQAAVDLKQRELDDGICVAQAGVQVARADLTRRAEIVANDIKNKQAEVDQAKREKEQPKEPNLARHAVEVAEDVVELELDLAKWATDHAKTTFNIRKVEFSGSVRSLVHPDEGGPPLRVKIEGMVLGEEINWEIVWKPKFDLVKFIKELFTLLWEELKRLVKEIV
ncbi:hypothetical protein CEP51_001507 [Fusarium floridanum]|uniref:Uncharacterized protein n=1 Tax=Fusarium floridanum TaxID=1325733 RepID=A0A428SGP0_9HYPO|nr:hypothetical protein CEP51_001507 [Fusarium floridanum]